MQTHASSSKRRPRHSHNYYKNEKHSLQGKTGKTHGIC